MIAVDTSALMAILLNEPEGDACADLLEREERLILSTGTMAEALIVAERRSIGDQMAQLIEGLGFAIVTVTPASSRRIAQAYAAWGKGVHPAGLNFGDCFAYEVAKDRQCPLLYVGDDFSKTDLESARLL